MWERNLCHHNPIFFGIRIKTILFWWLHHSWFGIFLICFPIFKSTPYSVCLATSLWSFQTVLNRHISCTAASGASWKWALFSLSLALISVHIPITARTRYLPCCCDKIPDSDKVKKRAFTLAHSPRGQYIVVWEGTAAGAWGRWAHCICCLEAERGGCLCSVGFCFYTLSRTPVQGLVPSTL